MNSFVSNALTIGDGSPLSIRVGLNIVGPDPLPQGDVLLKDDVLNDC